MEVLSTIGDVFGAIGSFITSVPKAISSILDFIYGCITECTALLGVIPTAVGTFMVSCLLFSVVMAIKRMVIN